ncbi:MAG TPA: hypothetical protein VFU63_12200, partial [Ktedonobacterales bacterium]|nr:hypothetical protein [Ktedonobacterales bacterium]
MTPDGLLEVTDLKQYDYCPRIPFYRYCLPRIRPITYAMTEGIRAHEEESAREERRSLRAYGLTDGERIFDVLLRSDTLGLVARIDLAIHRDHIPEAIVVDYKLSQGPAGSHFRVQVAAYALPHPPTPGRRDRDNKGAASESAARLRCHPQERAGREHSPTACQACQMYHVRVSPLLQRCDIGAAPRFICPLRHPLANALSSTPGNCSTPPVFSRQLPCK